VQNLSTKEGKQQQRVRKEVETHLTIKRKRGTKLDWIKHTGKSVSIKEETIYCVTEEKKLPGRQ